MTPKRMTGRLADESKVFAHRKHMEGWSITKIAAWLHVSHQAAIYKLKKYADLMEVDATFRKTEAMYCENEFLAKAQSFHRRQKKRTSASLSKL